MKMKCKHCDEVGCRTHCQDSPTGKHEANTNSLTVADDSDSKDIYVDVTCKHCSHGGTALITARDISW